MERERSTCTGKNLLSLSMFVKVEKLHTINAMFSLALLSIERLSDEMVNITPIGPIQFLLHFVMLTVQNLPHEELKSVIKNWNNQSAEKNDSTTAKKVEPVVILVYWFGF